LDWIALGALFFVSLVANIFSAFSGGGAGLIQLPVLIFLGLPFTVALATHKTATVALGIGATLRHMRTDSLEWRLSLWIMAWGIPGVILGASAIFYVPERWAVLALGLLTLSLGLYSIVNKQLGQHHQPRHRNLNSMILGGLVLFIIGALNGSLTSGTGLFCTLWLVQWFGLDYRRAVAYTLVLVGLAWNGVGAITLGALGNIQWSWLAPLLAGSFLGGYIGSHLAIQHGNRWIKRGFEVITILVGISLILK